MSELLTKIATSYVKPAFTEVKVGDTVRVYTKIKEGDKERTQYFEGLVIRRRGGIGPNASFTVRRLASGIGVERTFPVHSPLITRVQVQRAAKVSRATLYTIRGLTGKAARLKEKPVRQADREVTHPWPATYGVAVEDKEASPPDEEVPTEVAEDTAAVDAGTEAPASKAAKIENLPEDTKVEENVPQAQGMEQDAPTGPQDNQTAADPTQPTDETPNAEDTPASS